MERVEIREATLDDVEAAVRAYEAAWDAAHSDVAGRKLEELVPFEARVQAFERSIGKVSDDARVWLAVRDDEVIGVAAVRRQSADVAELVAIYVVPAAWGSGVGRALLDAARASMRAMGVSEALLWVVESNGRARRFYEREGWTADGGTKESPLGPTELSYRARL